MRATAAFLIPHAVFLLSGCWQHGKRTAAAHTSGPDARQIALVPHAGEAAIDGEIRRLQGAAERDAGPGDVEKLGWAFVAKARLSSDPGYYQLAQACASWLETREPRAPASLLLRGHVLESLHRFHEAEALGRELALSRGSPPDHGLLGDALMEQGRLAEAAESYQRMLDLKPCLQSYSRGAHLRWLRGDLEGARELARRAVQAGSPRDAEALAWAYSRLALYELQAGASDQALRASAAALSFQEDHAGALLVRGRVLEALGRAGEALSFLRKAAERNPLPEPLWTLAEVLAEAGNKAEARSVETRLEGAAAGDPRTFALYLATRGKEASQALRLAKEELQSRSDVFTRDVHAWALLKSGLTGAAREESERALAEGTQDARLLYHAGAIARAAGRGLEARRLLERAGRLRPLLLPSERRELDREMSEL